MIGKNLLMFWKPHQMGPPHQNPSLLVLMALLMHWLQLSQILPNHLLHLLHFLRFFLLLAFTPRVMLKAGIQLSAQWDCICLCPSLISIPPPSVRSEVSLSRSLGTGSRNPALALVFLTPLQPRSTTDQWLEVSLLLKLELVWVLD